MAAKLSDADVQARLADLPGWSLEEGMIRRTFAFASYKEGLVFAVAAGHLADRHDHHPDLLIGYRKVTVATSTHDADGITEKDFALAAGIDALA